MQIRENLYGPDITENQASFEHIIAQNEQKIFNLILSMTNDFYLAQDLTQETLLKAFQSRQSFQGKAKFSTWLYRIAVNVTIDYQRKSYTHRENPVENIETKCHTENVTSDPDGTCQKKAIKDILFQTVAKLPDQQREVFILREINGLSTKEVAEILDCTTELVKWRLHKARSAMRKNLQTENQYKNIGSFKLSGSGIE
ncbi:MAG: RNA polymerase sigma factor [Carboxydocellales bacterium]